MKINTFKQYLFSADLYKYSVTTDGTGGDVRTYSLARGGIKVKAAASGFGRLLVHFQGSDSDLVIGDRLHNLNDANGVELVDNGVWEITALEPVLSIWGEREGFKCRMDFVGRDG